MKIFFKGTARTLQNHVAIKVGLYMDIFFEGMHAKNVQSPLSVGNSSFTKYWYLLGYFCAVLRASCSKTNGYLADSITFFVAL